MGVSDSPAQAEPRLATDRDLDQLARLQAWRDSHESTCPGVERIKRWVGLESFWVIEVNAELVGWMSLEYNFFDEPFIAILWVKPEFRRKGIGSTLMNHARSISTSRRTWTSTNTSNGPMRELLPKLGWVVSGTLQHLDPDDPEIVYVHLGEEAEG